MADKKLRRSSSDMMIAGICGGVAEHLDLDPTIVRVCWVLATFFLGGGVIAYIICLLLMPPA